MSSRHSLSHHHDIPSQEPQKMPWLCFVIFGAAFVALGLLALGHLQAASKISTFVIGTTMLIGGSLGVGHSISVWHQDKSHFWAISGVFYLLSGMLVLMEPVVGLRVLTLMFAASLAISGVSRLVVGAELHNTPVLISGTASIIAGTIIGSEWPDDSLWVIGLVVALDLMAQGIALLCAGLALRGAPSLQS